MPILGVEKLIYGAEDVKLAVKFHRDWGLNCTSNDERGAIFDLIDGTKVEIYSADNNTLPPLKINWAPWGASTLREAVWGVDTQGSLDQFVNKLSAQREVTIDAAGVAHTIDDFGYAIGLAVSKKRSVKIPKPQINNVGYYNRFDKPSPGVFRDQAQPYSFSHIVYWVNRDPRKFIKFYLDFLGFKVTDQISDGSTFLQADGRTDHHNLFIQYSQDGYEGFQHISYEFKDFDAVMMLGLGMEAEGWKTNVGPLRHNIGSSLSWYIWNPAGGVAEALTDQDQLSDKWKARVVNTDKPEFYGHAWVARKEHIGISPAQWTED